MPRLLFFYLARRIALLAILIEVSLCVPVVMTSLFHYLPPAAIRGGLLMPALLGTLPTVFYLALPMSVGVAVAFEFSRMSSEGMIAVLYSIGLSVRAICAPAVFVSLVAVLAGFAISSIFAPTHVGRMHDVIHVIRHSLNHRMLDPAHFYTFAEGARTLYFQRWLSADTVAGLFIYVRSNEKNEEQIITAKEAEFHRTAQGVVMVMSKGSILTHEPGTTGMRSANFEEYVMPIDLQGSNGFPPRNWRGVFELSLWEFFTSLPSREADPRRFAEWMSEAAKRVGIPLLALTHSLLAIGLILSVAAATGRTSRASMATTLVIPAIHVTILISAETLVRQEPGLAWLVGAAIVAELVLAVLLIERQNADFPLPKPA
jgi:lipopolysaccharide export system permease protein